MDNVDPIEERILRRVPWEIVLVSFVLAIPAALVFDMLTAVFFFVGGAASAAGFAWLREAVGRLFLQPGKTGVKKAILIYALRLLLICAIFAVIIYISPRGVLAFVAGFSMLVAVALVEGIAALIKMRTWKV
jgi:hypothetical protein